MRTNVALMVALTTGNPATAEDVFVRPKACTLIATIQSDTCEVDNIYTCLTGNKTHERTESFDSEGLASVSTFNLLTGLSRTEFVWDDGSFWLEETGDSDADIIRKGSGKTSGAGKVRIFGMWRPITGTGESIYSGEKIELAGKLFHRIEDFGTFQMPPPMPEVVSSGVRVYNEELNLSISLEQKFDESVPASASSKLMQLSLQGQSGFGDEQPRFGCETLSSLSMQSLQGILA